MVEYERRIEGETKRDVKRKSMRGSLAEERPIFSRGGLGEVGQLDRFGLGKVRPAARGESLGNDNF